jgi:hypothetical protein
MNWELLVLSTCVYWIPGLIYLIGIALRVMELSSLYRKDPTAQPA